MNKRYLKILGEVIWATDNLVKEDLIRLNQRGYDAILDLRDWKMFDSRANLWVDIPGDSNED